MAGIDIGSHKYGHVKNARSFLVAFVCSCLAKHADARNLVTLKGVDKHLFVCFNDMVKINSIHRGFKKGREKNVINVIIRKRDTFEHFMAQLEKEGFLTKTACGKEYGKSYLKYEVKDSEIKELLTKNYSAQNEKKQVMLTKKIL